MYLFSCFMFFGYRPRMQNLAKNIIEYKICNGVCDLHRHESLTIMIQLQFFRVPWLDVAPPRLRSASTCEKLSSTAMFMQMIFHFRAVMILMLTIYYKYKKTSLPLFVNYVLQAMVMSIYVCLNIV